MTDTLPLLLCVGCAGLVSGLTGFAFALIASGTLLSIRTPVEATALVLVCSILSQAISILRLRTWPPRGTAFAMILPGLVGAPIGIHLLHDLDPRFIKAAIGAFLVLYSGGIALLRADYRVGFGNRWSDGAIGFLGGVLAGLALFARIDQRRFRTLALALLAAIGLTTTALALPGLLPG